MARGRRSKLSTELQNQICALIQGGNYIETAAACVGVDKKTLFEWLKRGNFEGFGKYREFRNAVQQAQGIAEAKDVRVIDQATNIDWKASAWRLERKFQDKWGHKQKVEADITVENIHSKIVDLCERIENETAEKILEDENGTD